jgi:hypothetical protein
MKAKELLEAGDLAAAIEQLNQEQGLRRSGEIG